MTPILLGKGDWELLSEDIGRVKTRNMYSVDNPFSPDNTSRITRPSIATFATVGAGPIMGIWNQSGAIGNRWLIVSGTTLYARETDGSFTGIGSVPGAGFCDFAAIPDRVIISRDGVGYSTDGIALSLVTMPDDKPVGSVASINGYFLLAVKNTNEIFWIAPFEVDPDPLNFFNAERYPDALEAVRVIYDEIWLLGQDGPEVWQTTGNSDSPFSRINGRVYSEGCETFTAVAAVTKSSLPALIWVTPNRAVVLAQGQVDKISNVSVENLLQSATNLRAWPIRIKRSDFYVLTCDQFTLVYDIQRMDWLRWDSYNYGYWRAHLGIQYGVDVYAGDALSGKIWKLGNNGFDDESTPMVKEATCFFNLLGEPMPCFAINVRLNSGWATPYVEPAPLELLYSDDLGFTWSPPIFESMGEAGEYLTDVMFLSLGTMRRPGRVFRFRHSGLEKLRLDAVVLNEMVNDNGN